MSMQKTKSIHQLEERMEHLKPDSLRYKILDSAKSFKSSWIELGQYLFSVYKDKLYKDWGYLVFESYCAKEIGIRQATAMKLLKSYSFLERQEPQFLKKEALEDRKPSEIPSYESVNALRLAKQSDKLSDSDYESLREEVLDDVKEESEVKKKIKYILKSQASATTPDQTENRKEALTQKFLSQLRATRNEFGLLSMPTKILNQIDTLVDLLEDYQK